MGLVFIQAITLSEQRVDLSVSNEPLGFFYSFFLVSSLVFALTVDIVEG